MLVVFFRSLLLYLLITFSMRLMGKRQLGELQPGEFVTTILISNIASLPIENAEIPMLLGVIPVLSLVAFEVLVSLCSLKFLSFRRLVSGSPMIVIENGVIDQNRMKAMRFSLDDLLEALRQAGVFDPAEVAFAIVETNGKVSVLPKFANRSVTPKDLKLKGEEEAPPFVLINDGQLCEETMQENGIDRQFVDRALHKAHQTLSTVFLMTCNSRKQVNIVPKQKRRLFP